MHPFRHWALCATLAQGVLSVSLRRSEGELLAHEVAGTTLGAGLQTLPLRTGARCLDGSPYSFYIKHGDPTKWSISLEGGEWCHTPETCVRRAGTELGSSSPWPQDRGCICANLDESGRSGNCTCVYLPYCDGALFAANVASPVKGWHGDQEFYLRGLRNLDATLDALQANFGLGEAEEVILMGHSAGALSSILHVDRLAKRMGPATHVRGVALHGFFLEQGVAMSGTRHKAIAMMEGMFQLHNLAGTANAWGARGCLDKWRSEAYRCLFAEEALPYVATPAFVANSAYDEFQLGSLASVPCIRSKQQVCTDEMKETIKLYGADFVERVRSMAYAAPRHGLYITSCICHHCPWGRLHVGTSKNFNAALGNWLHANESFQQVDVLLPSEHKEAGCIQM